MARILAIDLGKKRTGLAVTDALQIIATPLLTIETSNYIDYLKKYIAQEEVEKIVLGYPLNLDDTPTDNTAFVLRSFEQLKKLFPTVAIELYDEQYTSKKAVQAMVAMGMKKKDRRKKENIDTIAATILLQNYLSEKNNP